MTLKRKPRAPAEPSQPLTIDALARKARTTTRNVRAYTTRGLLPPPALKGRVGYYGPEHLARLRLISQLQERGYSLAAISDLLGAWLEGKDWKDVLGFEQVLTVPWSSSEPRVVDREALAQLAPHFAADEALLARAIELDVLERVGPRFCVRNEKLLALGRVLGEAGLPAAPGLEALALLRATVAPIAQGFVELFRAQVWEPFVQEGSPPERLPAVTAALEKLRPTAWQALEAVFSQAMDEAVAAATAQALHGALPAIPLAAGAKRKR